MIGLSRLERAIADVPKGGMQTGSPKVVLKLADAERIMAEMENLITERDALAAHNSELVSACKLAIDMFVANDCNMPNTIETLQDAIDENPQQCLAEIRAKAGRAGFIEGVRQMCENEIGMLGHDAESCANHYAAKVRQGGE